MPYELRALEAALLTVVKILDQQVSSLEAMTFPGARSAACPPACLPRGLHLEPASMFRF